MPDTEEARYRRVEALVTFFDMLTPEEVEEREEHRSHAARGENHWVTCRLCDDEMDESERERLEDEDAEWRLILEESRQDLDAPEGADGENSSMPFPPQDVTTFEVGDDKPAPFSAENLPEVR